MKINSVKIREVVDSRSRAFVVRVRKEFERVTEEKINDGSRLRSLVESRMAIGNATRPYATTKEIASVFGKDHSTVVYWATQHEALLLYSPEYRQKFGIATDIVSNLSFELEVRPRHRIISDDKRTAYQELSELQNSINNLMKIQREVLKDIGIEIPTI